jgi:hypothetical protein
MADKEKPLPKPPASPFGRKGRPEQGQESGPLMADRIATAAAEGKLEEFVKSEIPDSEHARKLVSMMMGMTGFAPVEMPKSVGDERPSEGPEPADASSAMPPEDVLNAVRGGDVQGLIGLLKRERGKRSPESEGVEDPQGAGEGQTVGKASLEKEAVDVLISIASENDVSPDWIIMRALRLYIREYQKTGRL